MVTTKAPDKPSFFFTLFDEATGEYLSLDGKARTLRRDHAYRGTEAQANRMRDRTAKVTLGMAVVIYSRPKQQRTETWT